MCLWQMVVKRNSNTVAVYTSTAPIIMYGIIFGNGNKWCYWLIYLFCGTLFVVLECNPTNKKNHHKAEYMHAERSHMFIESLSAWFLLELKVMPCGLAYNDCRNDKL